MRRIRGDIDEDAFESEEERFMEILRDDCGDALNDLSVAQIVGCLAIVQDRFLRIIAESYQAVPKGDA